MSFIKMASPALTIATCLVCSMSILAGMHLLVQHQELADSSASLGVSVSILLLFSDVTDTRNIGQLFAGKPFEHIWFPAFGPDIQSSESIMLVVPRVLCRPLGIHCCPNGQHHHRGRVCGTAIHPSSRRSTKHYARIRRNIVLSSSEMLLGPPFFTILV